MNTDLCQSEVCRPSGKGGPRQTTSVLCQHCAERFPRDLEAIADMWDDLVDRVSQPEDYVITERIKSTNESHGLVINENVSNAKSDLVSFTAWMVQTIVDNTTTIRPPASQSVVSRLRWIARDQPRMFTDYLDSENIIRAVSVAHHTRSNVYRNAYPSGNRRVDIPGECLEDVEDEDGELVQCRGELFGILRTNDSLLPSAIMCSFDESHTIPADKWVQWGRKLRRFQAA